MDIVAILKESIEISKRNPSLFIPTVSVGIVSFLLTLVFLGGSTATVAVTKGNVSPSSLGGILGSAALVLSVTAILGLIASAATIGMAGAAIARGAASLDTGLNAVKQTLGPVIAASVLLCFILGIGFVLFVIPGLVAVFFLLFTLPAVVLDRYGAVAAIKKSFDIVKANVSDVVILFVAILVIWIAFTIAQLVLNFIPLLGPLVSALLWGLFSAYISVVTVRFYRNVVPFNCMPPSAEDESMSSLLDRMYARYSNRRLFFRQGWGDMDLLRGLSPDWLQERAQAKISISWDREEKADGIGIRQGRFASPFEAKGFPPESGTAYVELILPADGNGRPPVCLHLAATGDEGFERRRRALALPLAKRGIGSLILENPYYGKRRPPGQHSKMLRCVSDIILMGSAALTEGCTLLAWLHREGYSRTGVSGISMGGHMAALVGALSPEPVAIAPCIAPHSPSAVFLDGILSRYCAWNALNNGHHGPEDAREFMTGLLDIMDIRRYPPPQAPAAACLVAALSDAYILPKSAAKLHRHWPGSSLRWLKGGHVGAFLFHRGVFAETIVQAFSRL